MNCFTLPDLFAGKVHALLFRKWKNRVKGRDWFDFEWYVRRSTPLNLKHLAIRAHQSGHIKTPSLSKEELLTLFLDRIDTLDIDSARSDVERFITTPDEIEIWSKDYFRKLVEKALS